MKPFVIVAAIVAAAIGATPLAAHASTDLIGEPTATVTSDLLNKIPGLGGGTTRHICLISNGANQSYCIYIPLP